MKEVKKYISILTGRNIWLVTLSGFLLVLLSWLIAGVDPVSGFSLNQVLLTHQSFPVLYLFDGFPLYLYISLSLARRRMDSTIDSYIRLYDERQEELVQSTSYARKLSEGEDPEGFPGMFDSDLGQALKLIQLNIKNDRRKEHEISWITEGKEMISRILRMHNDLDELAYQVLVSLSKYINAVQAAFYLYDEETGTLRNTAVFAYNRKKFVDQEFRIGEGLVGQCAFEMDYIYRTEIPDDYVSISSGILGDQKPKSILLIPLIANEALQGILEFAFFDSRITKLTIQFMLELGEIIARTVFNLEVNEKTRRLLEESRMMTLELQENERVLQENARVMKVTQEELQVANIQLKEKIKEEKLAQDRLHWLLKNSSEIISIYDESIRLKYISPSVENILGYSVEEMMGGKDFERIDQQGSIGVRKAIDHLMHTPSDSQRIEYSFARRDGSRVSLLSTIRNLLDDPSINGYLFNTRDITESRLVEKEQRLKSRMQSLSENSLDLILRLSTSGIIYYANPIIEDYSGIPPAAMMNKPLADVPFQKAMSDIITNALHRISGKAEKFIMEASIPVPMGEQEKERIVNFNVIPEFQENELETLLIVGHDITEAKRIEREIKVTNRKIQDSINYAERIQSSILPSINSIRKAFPESFTYYLPRDVISGDFPWFFETEEAYLIAAIDCTGHGVPGALLSFIGFFLLNNITALNPEKSAGEICDELHREVRHTLKQDQKNPETRDGMDLALCKIDKGRHRLEFVGAHRPMYLLREGEIISFRGDRKAIGGMVNPRVPSANFTTHVVELRKGDKIFIFSDGLTDQLGGPDGTKYSPARIRDILLEHPGYTLSQFHEHIRDDFNTWLGEGRQIDDVLMIGIEF